MRFEETVDSRFTSQKKTRMQMWISRRKTKQEFTNLQLHYYCQHIFDINSVVPVTRKNPFGNGKFQLEDEFFVCNYCHP